MNGVCGNSDLASPSGTRIRHSDALLPITTTFRENCGADILKLVPLALAGRWRPHLSDVEQIACTKRSEVLPSLRKANQISPDDVCVGVILSVVFPVADGASLEQSPISQRIEATTWTPDGHVRNTLTL
jgi:hypothetical protein